MKKFLAIFLSVLLICAAIPFAVATAVAEPTIELPDLQVKPGDIIEVPVLLKNNPGIVSAKIKVEYDSDVLELLTYYNEDEETDMNMIVPGADYDNKWADANAPLGDCQMNFCHGTSKSKNYTGELFYTATFKVKENAVPGTYDLTVVHDNKDFFNCVNDGEQQIDFATKNGTITVLGDEPVTPDEPTYTEPTIVVPHLEVEAGAIIEVPVLLKNNPGIVSAKIKVEYDSNVLELLTYYNEDEEADMNMIVPGADYDNKWADANAPLGDCQMNFCHGTSKSKNYTGELFYTATFKVKENAVPGTYALTIVHDNKDFFNCVNDGEQQIDFAVSHGSVTVKGDVPPACTEHEYDGACDPECNVCGDIRPVHTEGIAHFDAVPAGCHYVGNIEYWYCPECEMFWADEALTLVTNYLSTIVPALGGNVVAHEAVEPGCHYAGNIAYWTCADCEQVWQDEALTQLTNSKNVILPAIGGDVEHVKAVEPTCSSEGNVEYWYCADCEQVWVNEALTQLSNLKNVKIGTTEHNIVYFEAVEPGCHYIGNIEYWFCTDCEIVWQDAELTQITNLKNVILPAKGGNVVHFDAVQPGCHYIGNIEYWYCAECEQFWQDEALTQITNSKNVILPAVGSDNLQHVEAKAPTCDEIGNIEYWYCPDCEQYWQDAALTQLTNAKNVILPAIDHANLVHFDAVEAGCHYNGNIEYWMCYDCEIVWADEALTQITNVKNVVVPALKDSADYVAAKTPTCTENGNVEYWYCADCEQVWADEALTQLSNLKNVQIAPSCKYNAVYTEGVAAGCHYDGMAAYWYCANCDVYYADAECTIVTNYKNLVIPALKDSADYVEAKTPTCTENGNVEYWTCADCEQVWADAALTQLTNIKNVQIAPSCSYNAEYHKAVDAGCHFIGNTEYWYCANCDVFYADEACTIVTNYLNTLVPALGGNVTHVEAVEAGCHYIGNIEYWYCSDCDQYWSDEALTQITNAKSVIVPALESTATYVPATEPTCETEGNVEYWYCDKCEQVWVDEALTQLSNIKNVKIAVLEHDIVHMDAVPAGCHYVGNIEYWFCVNCNAYWADEALTLVTNYLSTIVPAKGGDVVAHEAVEPGCHYAGNIAYWTCAECEQVWADEALTQLTNIKNVILPALESTATYVPAKDPTCDTFGNVEYWFCDKCEQVWVDEALTQLSNLKNVQIAPTHTNVVYMEAVEAGCHYNGNVEHWICYDCGAVYTDEALTELTNAKNVIIPAKGGDVVAFEAIQPGCHYNGRIAYWYCAECDQFWADEALTQLTNSKNVILPATGSDKLQHVEAKEPTATENGNVEYWFCAECEQVWVDEALTQLSNLKNVIIPATGEVEPDSPATGDSVVAIVVALLTLIASGVAVFVLKNKKRA